MFPMCLQQKNSSQYASAKFQMHYTFNSVMPFPRVEMPFPC